MQSSNRFKIWCVVAAMVALCLGMLAGTASAMPQESQSTDPDQQTEAYLPDDYVPPSIEEPPMPEAGDYVPPDIAEPGVQEPEAVTPSEVVDTRPPRPTDLQLYQQYLARLLQLNVEIAAITVRIGIYEAVAMAEPEDPFIQYELQLLWFQLGMMQMEQTEVRFVLTTLNP